MAHIRLRHEALTSRDSFHDEFKRLLGFPDGYTHDMGAWRECMAALRSGDGTTAVVLAPDELLWIEIPEAARWRAEAPDLFSELLDGTASVNERCTRGGGRPAVALVLA